MPSPSTRDRSQPERTRALEGFKSGEIRVLVATDVAARGLDIEDLPVVVNFELPWNPQDYVHRIGRTGRAGQSGEAISLVCMDEVDLLRGIQRMLKKAIPWTVEEGFVPDRNVEARPLSARGPSSGARPPSRDRRRATLAAQARQAARQGLTVGGRDGRRPVGQAGVATSGSEWTISAPGKKNPSDNSASTSSTM